MDLLEIMKLSSDDLSILNGEQSPEEGELVVESSSLTDKKSTVFHIHMFLDGMEFSANGSSHRVKGDVYDPALGDLIAVERAMERIIDQMKRKIKKLSNEADAAALTAV